MAAFTYDSKSRGGYRTRVDGRVTTSLRRAVVIGMAPLILQATSVCFGAIGFDALLAAALTGKAAFLAFALIDMGIATLMLWAKDRAV